MNNEVNEKLTNDVATEEVAPVKKSKMLALGIISAVLFALVTGYMLWTLIDTMGAPAGMVALYILIVIIYGSIGYGVCLIYNAIAMIIAVRKKANGTVDKKTVAYFITFTVLPVVMWITFFMLGYVFAN